MDLNIGLASGILSMPYDVTIMPSGHRIVVEEDESVLEAALRQGLVIPYSCRGGTCGSCMGKVVSGAVRYLNGRPPALSDQEELVGQALFCQARPAGNLVIEVREIREAGDIQPRKLPCRVMEMKRLSPDVMRLRLKLPQNERLAFLAGQYIDILLRDGRRRGFSLANPPHDDEFLELHVRHMPGGVFSDYVFLKMQEKALLRFEGPLGTFYLREESPRPILMMGGGTGFAPLKGILEHAFHSGVSRPMHLFWGARARQDLYLDALPRQWAEEHGNFKYTPVLSEPAVDDDWDGETGWVHQTLLREYSDLEEYDVYMSGPPAMIAAAKRDFAAHGLRPEHLYYDSFEVADDAQPKK